MAVNVGQRNVPDTNANRKFDAVDKCQHLCRHVLHLTANSKVLECPHAEHGNSYQLLENMDEYYRDLKWRAGLYAA